MSRMIAFDDWSLFLVAMETFRLYGGDFVVGYLECAIKEVADLMKIYENDGLLKIRKAYKAADIPNIPYDPDSQTEYANQMTNSHLCLYEFKESVEFIAFTDWDDILIGPRNNGIYGKIIDSFHQLSSLQPNVGAFSVQRIPFIAQKQKNINEPFALKEFIYSSKLLDPKMVVRPTVVAGVWIHALKIAESPNFYGISINSTNLAVLLHFKISNKKKLLTTNDFKMMENNEYFNSSLMETNMKNMFDKSGFSFNPSKYPRSNLFYRLINNCYVKMEKGVQDDTIPFCPTHKACKYPKQNVKVVKVITTHKLPKKMGRYIWHERDSVQFETCKEGCL
uniref:Glycosyltransferase family 92 protein n=1 Tax=Panagrolaimus sp. ES5 TaxID=591445 RepID=A0AC34GSR0_9BILA